LNDIARELAVVLAPASQAFLWVTFAVVAIRAFRERRAASVDIALLFGTMALLVTVSRIAAVLGAPREARLVISEALILALPYLMLRLVGDFAAIRRPIMWGAGAGFVALTVTFVLLHGALPPALGAAATAYVVAPIAWSALAFARQARRSRGVTGRRYTAIAIGTVFAAVSLFGAGAIAALPVVADTPIVLVQPFSTLGAGIAYLVGFAPPLWLRRLWQEPELRSFLSRAPQLAASADTDGLLRELASGARSALGFDGVLIGVPAGSERLRFVGTGASYEAPVDETFAGRAIRAGHAVVSLDPVRDVPARADLYRERDVKMLVAAPIRTADEVLGAISAMSSHVSIFADDDLAMCQLLADQAAVLIKHRALVEERERRAELDPLTDLPDARRLHRALVEAHAAAAGGSRPFALLVIDLDDFVEVNQTFGHVVGDQLLVRIAERLASVAAPPRMLARWGGDQFGLLLPGEGLEAAERVAGGLLAAFEQPFAAAEGQIEVGASVGIAVYPDHADDVRGIEAAADIALGIAKRSANTYAVCPPEIHPQRVGRLALRAELRRAIADGSLGLRYQPLVALRSGEVVRFEALARWDHPDRGTIPPAEFVQLAERTGLIRPLTELVLDRALADVSGWRRSLPRLRVAVNLSARAFADASLIDRIRAATSRAGTEPRALSVEITEGVLMTEPEHASHTIGQLRELGVGVEIDDFGTGYSSLAYLQRLPVDGIKIDRQFIVAMATEERSDAIVRAAIRLSHELGFEVIAEGVEERRQWELLAASGCDVVQGYFVARPMPADEVLGWIASWRDRTRAEKLVARTERPRTAAGRAERLVLVVDDDPAILSIVRDVLREHGYAVATASNGEEALALVGRTRPSVVLLDVHMPLVDGGTFARKLHERGLDVPLVVMTAGPNAQFWAERLSASGHLAKPFAVDQLLAVTDRVIAGAPGAN